MTEPSCLRCGRCCHVIEDGKVIKCRNCIFLPSGKTLCRIFNKRVGFRISKHYACAVDRQHSDFDYVGCPFNTNKKIERVYKNDSSSNNSTGADSPELQ